MATKPSILFVTHPYPNYVPDLLLHGLRKLLGSDVVDYPRKACLYEGVLGLGVCPEDQRCPGWFPDDHGQIDRTDIWHKVQRDYFDLVVCDLRAVPQLTAHLNGWPKRCVIVDGEDHPQLLTPGPYIVCRRETDGSDYTIPLPMALPEEILNWIARYDGLPKRHSIGFLGSTRIDQRKQLIETLAKYYPDALFQVTEIPKQSNPAPDGRMGRDQYYRQLQQCRMVLSLPGAGSDTFRFWEDAACNAVHLAPRIPLFIPDDFVSDKEIIRFGGIDELLRKIDGLASDHHGCMDLIRGSRQKLVQYHLTTHRALYFLERAGRSFGHKMGSPAAFSTGRHRITAPGATPAKDISSTIHLGLVRGENYGWGVCSSYLIDELSKFRSVHLLKERGGSAFNPHLKGKLVQALTTVEFSPLFEKARADQNFGYTFFEEELNETSVRNAGKYDLVLAGSTWCRDRLLEKGIQNCEVLLQGIDPKLFYPIEKDKRHERFVIFSGGKFELRKGQDLVLRAVKVLQDKYRDVYLMNCWYNLWPQSISQMSSSPYISFSYHENEPWIDTMQRTCRNNGLDPDRVITLGPVPHHKQRELFQHTDIGVFPNRCEGGTNLVLMEYMACAKPVIASNTSGHIDIINENNALLLNQLEALKIRNSEGALIARWQDPSLDELIASLEYAYHHRDELYKTGRRAGEDLRHFTWKRSAEHLAAIIDDDRQGHHDAFSMSKRPYSDRPIEMVKDRVFDQQFPERPEPIREKYGLSREAVSRIDLKPLSKHAACPEYRGYFLNTDFAEHYQLLAHLSTRFDNATLFDIGTLKGYSALALSYNPANSVISYDIKDFKELDASEKITNIVYRIGNALLDPKLLSSSLILLDTQHDGTFENEVYAFLKQNHYKGLLILDDIYLNDAMKQFWHAVDLPKEDLTDIGHWSGTGIVDFGR